MIRCRLSYRPSDCAEKNEGTARHGGMLLTKRRHTPGRLWNVPCIAWQTHRQRIVSVPDGPPDCGAWNLRVLDLPCRRSDSFLQPGTDKSVCPVWHRSCAGARDVRLGGRGRTPSATAD
jgi:hypothetical protein